MLIFSMMLEAIVWKSVWNMVVLSQGGIHPHLFPYHLTYDFIYPTKTLHQQKDPYAMLDATTNIWMNWLAY